MDHFLCTLTHNSPRCSLLRNGTQMDSRNPSSALCYPCRSLRSPSRHQPRLWAQLTRQHREGPLPFSGPFGQRVHGWRQLELPPLYHQLLAASAAQQLRAPSGARSRHAAGRQHLMAPPLTCASGDSLTSRHGQLSNCKSRPQIAPTHRADWPDTGLGLGQREVGWGGRWRRSAGAGGVL